MDKNEFIGLLQSYQGISAILRNCTHQEIVSVVAEIMKASPEDSEQCMEDRYSIDGIRNTYHAVLEDLLRNIDYYDWLYERLADDISRNAFTTLIQFRLLPSMQSAEQECESIDHK